MAETCIVCLGDLRLDFVEETTSDVTDFVEDEARRQSDARRNTRLNSKSIDADEEVVAHLLPCKHDLHNACLKPWVERANSCPICRATFNMVELTRTVGGEVIDSYAVQDKVQAPEIDPTMVVEDEDELIAIEAWEPCLVCGSPDDSHGVMYCDGCDKTVHVFCAGFDDAPEVWYCENCHVDLDNENGLPRRAAAVRRRPRRRTGSTRPRGRHDAIWARVWQEVSRRLDLDLDFPFDEETTDARTDEQRREFARWQRRFEVANSQGAANRLRGIANARLHLNEPAPAPKPESQDELRAWNAFDKARESQEAPSAIRRNKRKTTASPATPEPELTAQPQQKRPRLRRPRVTNDQDRAESSNAAAARAVDEPTFLSSLLHEVESKPISAGSPGASDQHISHFSPGDSSSNLSPPSSGHATPRAHSVTPPPRQRPLSPPLSSIIMPVSSPIHATFSPFSPTDSARKHHQANGLHHRGRRRADANSLSDEEQQSPRSASPARGLSLSAKSEVQRMVKLALRTRYHEQQISREQYIEINRDVSRKLYELVGTASALTDQAEREKWQGVADDEVKKAIAGLSSMSVTDE